jgi:Mg2+-importing ATPase
MQEPKSATAAHPRLAAPAEFRRLGRRPPGFRQPDRPNGAFWSLDPSVLLRRVDSTPAGLSHGDAAQRLKRYGPNERHQEQDRSSLAILWRQLRSPRLRLLVFEAVASAFSGEWIDATIVVTIVAATAAIGFTQAYSAQSAAAPPRLRARCTVLRDGRPAQIALAEVVPGDVILLSAGSLVSANGMLPCRRARHAHAGAFLSKPASTSAARHHADPDTVRRPDWRTS